MIGNPKWFERRKYGGWGITPKTWQGWVYITLFTLPFIIFQSLPFWDDKTRLITTVVWVALLLMDVSHIMLNLKKDEREYKIEAISERNVAWFMMLILVIGILYQSISSALNKTMDIDWFLFAALIGGALIKTISNLYLEKRSI